MLDNPVAKRTAIAAGIGALIAIPVPFVGPIFGAVVGGDGGVVAAGAASSCCPAALRCRGATGPVCLVGVSWAVMAQLPGAGGRAGGRGARDPRTYRCGTRDPVL